MRHTLHVFYLLLFFSTVAQSQFQRNINSTYRSILQSNATFNVLVFSKTEGFRHVSIADGISAITTLGSQNDFSVDATEDAALFNDDNLAQYAAVIFLNTTGDVLNSDQQAAFERYIRSGRGYVGVHSAADTEYSWPWYGDLVGAYFQSHPNIQQATIKVADATHPSSSHLPDSWIRTDEWYNYQGNPRGDVHVIATLDEGTYSGGSMGYDHPIAWCQEFDGGRSWYTGGGHTNETFSEPLFLDHLLGGILFAAGEAAADCGATIESNFEKVILDDNTQNPMELAVAPDGRVFYIERSGSVKIFKPENNQVTGAGVIPVATEFEDGLLGITLDPDFETNQWIYLFYSPAGSDSKQHVSRFTMIGDQIDISSEKLILEIPTQREQCCHSGGSLTFGPDGNLFISTGDNTNPFESDGYAPIDERPGRSAWDAQKSSGNRNDLRGKILRIIPQADGSYTIPSGNLFPSDGSDGRPEVYVMGTRNPFRISVDAETGWLYWGDVGPDAGDPNPNRGPAGYDEWNQARTAGNYGGPYSIGNNEPYRDFNFATGVSGVAFDPNNPVNNSPNNTGGATLPPARPAMVWYPYGPTDLFPEIGAGGRTAMAGPVYHFDGNLGSENKLPEYYDKTLFIYEWSRNWIQGVKFDDNGNILKINPFLPNFEFLRPMDMELGPDGALYVIEWGSGFFGDNADSKLIKIQYSKGSRAPVAIANGTPTSGPLPLTVQFSSEGSFDPDIGDVLSYAWSFEGDGTINSTDENPEHTYTIAGNFSAQLTVTDSKGNQDVATVPITAGNTVPEVTIHLPVDGGFYDWGESFAFEVQVDDAEDGSTTDGSIACTDVTFQAFIGHDDHAHPLEEFRNCAGDVPVIGGHGSQEDLLFYVVEGRYTDNGVTGVSPITGRAGHILQPKRKQAEHFTENNGVLLEDTGDILGGGQNIGFIAHGDFISYYPMNLQNIDFVTYRIASAGSGGRIEVRVDSPQGPLISTAYIEHTRDWQFYRNATAPISDPGGVHELFFVFLNNPGDDGLFNLNWIDFHGDGVSNIEEGSPDGLSATYFNFTNLSGSTVTRVDPMVNFNWADGSPDLEIGNDTFSARWTGQVEAERTESYTFYLRIDDGARLWINNQLIIDKWFSQGITEYASAPMALAAGQRYDIKLEYFENSGDAQIDLLWSSPSTPQQNIPRKQLYSQNFPTGITGTEAATIPLEFQLYPAFPNPFNPETTIQFDLPNAAEVRLEVFDILGQSIEILVDESRAAGSYSEKFIAADLASGVYIYRLTAAGRTLHRRMILMK